MKKLLSNLKIAVKTIWYQFGTIKSGFSFLLAFLIVSGLPFIALGYILSITSFKTVGYGMLSFYFFPTASLLINILLSLLFQRYVLRDKSISVKQLKETYQKIKNTQKGEKNESKRVKEIRTKSNEIS